MQIRTTFVAVGTFISLAMTSCEKKATPPPAEPPPEPQQSQANEPVSAPPLASAATPLPVAPPPAATPAPAHLAPEGVYFLTRAVSVETADGIIGLSPGTQAVRQADGRYLADGHTVDLQPAQITNDLRAARQAAAADQSAQQRILQALKTSQATPPPAASTANQDVPSSDRIPPPISRRGPAEEYVEGVARQQGGLESSTGLNAQHTRTGEGLLWQKSPDGKWWIAVKRLNGKPMGYIPPKKVQ